MVSSVIAIGGPHGSGKSSMAKRLSEEFDMNYVSAGDVFRKLAEEEGYTLKEFSKIVIERPEIDRKIDNRTKELSTKPMTIVDAQLAAHFTPKDSVLKICITADPDIRYQRIAERENKSIKESRTETMIREKAEKKRYYDLYQIDVEDHSFYDVIINTNRLSYDKTYQICKVLVSNALKSIT